MNPSEPSESPSERELFFEALGKASLKERSSFLDGACYNRPELRRRLEELLASHLQEDSFMKEAAFEDMPTLDDVPVSEGPGSAIGRYKLLQKVGEGGMGVVYMAEQTEPVTRKVALKIIKLGMDTKQVVARFEAERQALAMMDHPNIAKVLDAGATETGRPYFVMELVRGVPITEYCDKNRLSTQARLNLFIPVCQAIQHAHQKGIIHRDIKPSNVMVTLHDGNALPKVIDFGIAKATNQKLTEKTLFTNYAQIIGTPAYMSPEQAEMSGLDVDTRTDVYSLGVLLYELLTGTTPFPSKELLSMGYGQMQKVIAEKEPPKPSTRLSTMQNEERTVTAGKRNTEALTLHKEFQGDLDWIVMKALEKDRTQRYETVNGLVADVRRHLDNEPVSAVAPTFNYQLQKFYRRNRKYMRVAAVIAGLLVLTTGFATFQAVKATRAERTALAAKANESAQRIEAENSRKRAVEAQASEAAQRKIAVQKAQEAETARQQADRRAADLKENLYFQNIALAYREMSADRPASALNLLNDCPKELRGWEWDHVRHRSIAAGLPVTSFPGTIYSMAVSSNGRDVALLADGSLYLAELTTAGTLKRIGVLGSVPLPVFEAQSWCVFSPDGRFLASVSMNGAATLWDVENRSLVHSFRNSPSLIDGIVFDPTGEQIAVVKRNDSEIAVWNIERESLDLKMSMEESMDLYGPIAYSPDGQWLAAGIGFPRIVQIWEAATGRMVAKLEYQSPVAGLAFSPDGQWLAAGGNTTLKLWDVSNWKPVYSLEGHTAWITALAFTPDGTRLVSAGLDREIKIWEPFKERKVLSLAGHTSGVSAVAVTRDGRIVSGGMDSTVRVWEVSPLVERRELASFTAHSNRVFSLAFDPDPARRGRLVSADEDGRALVWDTIEQRQIDSFDGIFDVVFSPDRRFLVAPIMGDPTKMPSIGVRDASSPEKILSIHSFPTGHLQAFSADISPDGKWVVGGTAIKEILVWDRQSKSQNPVSVLSGHKLMISNVRFSPDGRYLVSMGEDGEILRWDVDRLSEAQKGVQLLPRTALRELPRNGFSPDGLRLATGDGFEGIFIIDMDTGKKLLHIPQAHGGIVMGVKFSPDGRRLASCGMDNMVRLWNAETGEALRTFIGHTATVYDVAFSPDGHMLASCGLDQTVKLWEAVDSVAVLPFVNTTGDPTREYLSDGITESLINSLSHLPDLNVKSRDSAFFYKGKNTNPQIIGRELGVRNIFKGRVVQQGDNLILSAELIDTESKTILWSGDYPGKASDILPLQSELAREMTMALRLRLTGEEEKRVVESHTADPEAYRDYLQGRYWLNRSTEKGFRTGIHYFQRAIEKDSGYALAYAGLAECQMNLAIFSMVPPHEGFSKARETALKALEMDDTLPEAHAVVGLIKAKYDWDWSGGEIEFQRAIALNPYHAGAHELYGQALLVKGHLEGAAAEVNRVLEIDPFSVRATLSLAMIRYIKGQNEDAISQGRKLVGLAPNFIPGHVILCLAYLQQSDYEQGIAEIGKTVAAFPDSNAAIAVLGYAYAVAGRKAEALDVLERLDALSKQRYVPPTSAAMIHAALGEKDRAFKWLQKAYEDRSILSVGPFQFAKQPAYDPLRSDPRFADLLRRMNLEP